MSFILDALKKSENERQRTIGPSLADAPARTPQSERPWWAVAVAVFVSLILWRAFEQAAVDPLALWSRLVAIALATLLFVFLRANPFRVEPRLT